MTATSDDPRDTELARLRAEVERLTHENAALRGGPLATRPADPNHPAAVKPTLPPPTHAAPLSTRDKLALFRARFAGRVDVYPLRWQNAQGRSGYAPACANEWVSGLCAKPKVKCSDCPNQAFRPVTDETILDHLQGKIVAGVYALLPDDRCHFLAVDFDEADWRDDALAYATTARAVGVDVAIEVSRSGAGAHAWIFFAAPVLAATARRLGTALITATCRERRQLRLQSYDRLFPSQDTLPAGGFGNLIALPFQAEARARGCTVFVDDVFKPYPDQWRCLAAVRPLSETDVNDALLALRSQGPDVDAALLTDDDEQAAAPWVRRTAEQRVPGPAPERLTVTRAQQLYIEKNGLSARWIHRLVRLAAFQNPAFYQAQAMRRSVWSTPRLIGSAENHPNHIALPRGLFDAIAALAHEHNLPLELSDLRQSGTPLLVRFTGTLTQPQQTALEALATHDTGLLWGATGFGKTVVAAALIARRAVSSLVLVHRAELLVQWRARLATFLDVPMDAIGALGAGTEHLTGSLDVALLQSLSRRLDAVDVTRYGHVMVDECHHIPAVSFEQVLKTLPAKYVTGLTATPIRRDGQHPIMAMQIGPIRYGTRHAVQTVNPARVYLIRLKLLSSVPPDGPIQSVLAAVAHCSVRTERIVADVARLVANRRHVLLLTERTEHLDTLGAQLDARAVAPLFRLHGRMSARLRAHTLAAFRALAPTEPFVLLATGRLIGEGFDDPRFDALVLALPFSWKGTLQQYIGRLNRSAAGKLPSQILDYADVGVPVLERMAHRRRAGYAALGVRVIEPDAAHDLPELDLQ